MGAAATVGGTVSERERTSGLTLSSMLVGWPSSWDAVRGRVSAPHWGDRVRLEPLQHDGGGGGVVDLEAGVLD